MHKQKIDSASSFIPQSINRQCWTGLQNDLKYTINGFAKWSCSTDPQQQQEPEFYFLFAALKLWFLFFFLTLSKRTQTRTCGTLTRSFTYRQFRDDERWEKIYIDSIPITLIFLLITYSFNLSKTTGRFNNKVKVGQSIRSQFRSISRGK